MLELVEGETLAERIAQGPMPVDEALAVARQIADALEAAHEKGDRPPGPEAGQREGDAGGQGQGAGLRAGEGAVRRRLVAGSDALADADGGRDAGGGHPRDGGVHVARAGARQAGGQAGGHLGVRRRAVRDALRTEGRSRARPSRTRWPRCCAPTSTGRGCPRTRRPPCAAFCAAASTATRSTGCATSATRGLRSRTSPRAAAAGARRPRCSPRPRRVRSGRGPPGSSRPRLLGALAARWMLSPRSAAGAAGPLRNWRAFGLHGGDLARRTPARHRLARPPARA